MQQPSIPHNEIERLKALKAYQLLDTLAEQDFDDITQIASEICQTPISLITLVDENRQWFKSKRGIAVDETPREIAFCAHAIMQPHEMLIVDDPQHDDRFHDNPLVIGEPNIRFYVGVPLVNPEGFPLGTLCIIDKETRSLAPHQISSLKALANQVVAQFELRRKNKELHQSQLALQEANQALETFAHNAAHDLKNPLNNIIALTELLERFLPADSSEKTLKIVHRLNNSAHRLTDMVEGLLKFACTLEISAQERESVDVKQLMDEITSMMTIPPNFRFDYTDVPPYVVTSRTALQHILSNLCTNAIKYNDKEEGYLKLTIAEDEDMYTLRLTDNGAGIRKESFEIIFDMFTTLGQKDRFGKKGTGLGLSIVKKLVEKLGGTTKVNSQLGEGTTFEFTLAKHSN